MDDLSAAASACSLRYFSAFSRSITSLTLMEGSAFLSSKASFVGALDTSWCSVFAMLGGTTRTTTICARAGGGDEDRVSCLHMLCAHAAWAAWLAGSVARGARRGRAWSRGMRVLSSW